MISQPVFSFTAAQQQKALRWLVFWHILVIAASNYLVQIPFVLFGFHTTWGAFTFPFIFLTTDLTVRIFGAWQARKIIFFSMLPALVISYVISILFADGQLRNGSASLYYDSVAARIALASMLAYFVGQFMDITVFNRLRALRFWWIAPAVSTIIGNAVDTLIFFASAFYRSADEFMAAHWQEIAMIDYVWKLIICMLFFLPAYGLLLKYLTNRLTASSHYTPSALPHRGG